MTRKERPWLRSPLTLTSQSNHYVRLTIYSLFFNPRKWWIIIDDAATVANNHTDHSDDAQIKETDTDDNTNEDFDDTNDDTEDTTTTKTMTLTTIKKWPLFTLVGSSGYNNNRNNEKKHERGKTDGQ